MTRGHSRFALGHKARLTVPANACRLLELRRAAEAREPVLVGMAGRVELDGDRLSITGVRGKPGQVCPLRVRLTKPGAVKRGHGQWCRAAVSAGRQGNPPGRAVCGRCLRPRTGPLDQARWQRLPVSPMITARTPWTSATKFTINKDVAPSPGKGQAKNFSGNGRQDCRLAGQRQRVALSQLHLLPAKPPVADHSLYPAESQRRQSLDQLQGTRRAC